jgi:hypothetical protein
MEFKRLNKRKKPNNKRGLLLVLLLFIIIYLWYNIDSIMTVVFNK